MDQILDFVYEDQNVRTILVNDNEILFRAKDVSYILGYDAPKKVIKRNVFDEDKISYKEIMNDNEDSPDTIYLKEAGLYTLIMKSSKENAVEFQRWVTNDVLPSIRKDETIKKLATKLSKKLYVKGDVIYVYQTAGYEDTDLYKIGYSKNLNGRKPTYNTGLPVNGTIVYHLECLIVN